MVTFLVATPAVQRARLKWRYTGRTRPPFAVLPKADQESVWDFRRPPKIEPTEKALRVESGGTVIAVTKSGRRVLETAGAPTYYFPPQDVNESLVRCTEHVYHCEWKGISRAFATQAAANAGWILEAVYPEFSCLYGWYAFYPQQLQCFVGQERVRAQPGGYYGGWVTHDILGPIKGEPGSDSW